MSEEVVLGIDIGGTKVAVGLVNSAGRILSLAREPMNVNGTAEDAMKSVERAIAAIYPSKDGHRVLGVGVASPGPLDPKLGLVLHTPNLPCWREYALVTAVEAACGIPARLDNDANVAGLAEALWGAGANQQHVLYVTIGTGIGTAIILDGRIYHGRTGAAAEGGHMTIDFHAPVRCGCGKRGCVESMASGPAIAARARDLATENPSRAASLIAAAGSIDKIATEHVFSQWEAGQELAVFIVDETLGLLSIWLGNMIDLFEPDVVIVGGGVGMRLQPLFQRWAEQSARWSINHRAAETPIVPAKYGVDAGIAGSAALWFQDLRTHVGA